jgi:hypothetical protein
MFNVNGFKATLVQNNRTTDELDYYDDQNKKEVEIKVCPYNVDQSIRFGEYTTPEATGYFITKANVDVEEGDELIINGHTYSILKVQDDWIWNKVANIILAVK